MMKRMPIHSVIFFLLMLIVDHQLATKASCFAFQPDHAVQHRRSNSATFGHGDDRSCRVDTSLFATNAGVCSVVGSDPNRPQKVNQDAFFVVEDMIMGYSCYGVMDGHGLKGHILTEYLARRLPFHITEELKRLLQPSDQENYKENQDLKDFEEQLETLGNFVVPPVVSNAETASDKVPQALIRAFHRAHVDAMKNPDIPAGKLAGTTCIACVMNDSELHVAYVGDSRAIQIVAETGRKEDDNLDPVVLLDQLTTETTIKCMPSEQHRIEQGQGRVDENGNIFYGPVGIAMTRALGDAVMLRAGVVPTPIVKTVPRVPRSIIVLATDGIWDVLSNDKVAEIVGEKQLQPAADDIVHEAKLRWIGDLPLIDEAKIDDMTCVIFET